ncbi:uridine 5'-monophosphate synthase-like isoform X1 [Oratosquilla oratoria]|uniref:uridine 5'-monophosphate synthase-like isoform X1 n=2 Tax=Oratosquilla oratoria TaxID=337810 RepID=UPI003F75F6B8
MADNPALEQCLIDLHKIGVIKFGDFTLKSGMQSPVYFDLRIIVSFPKILEKVADLMWASAGGKEYHHICGVPYTGLPIATCISLKKDLPMLVRRKEKKSYGTKKMVEGIYKAGEKCLMIEDVVVSGASVYETVLTLQELELDVTDAVVFLDREQGGPANLHALGINVIAVVTITEMMAILLKHSRINQATADSVIEFINCHNETSIVADGKATFRKTLVQKNRTEMSFGSRIQTTVHPVAQKLLALMVKKKSNLCVAADVDTSAKLLELAEKVGPFICLFKTHMDIIKDFSKSTISSLKDLAVKHDFILFEDRKFGDIGNTVASQYGGGLYDVVDWADIVTVHGLPGDGVIKGLVSAVNGQARGCMIVAQMSSEGSLTSESYSKACVEMAEDHTYFVMGFISQGNISQDPRFLHLTPGVQIEGAADKLGQQYCSPRSAVLDKGADIIIVGRGIIQAEDPALAAQAYQEKAYAAYVTRIE